MEQLESFIDAFITNMPDVLRRLRTDEDEQRQLSQTHEHDLDLERFLVTISFAFEGRPEAAQVFWSDSDSNLAGFLHWASRRASTPLVSAFCEMLQAISENEECATSAHEFLIDEGVSSSGKMRRNHSLTWNQIFKELSFFSSRIRDRPAVPQSSYCRSGKANNEQAETEPESAMMLESYLRLITRLCTESVVARTFLLKHPTFRLTELLYQLASSLIPSRLRACAFTTLRSLTSRKTREEGEYLWNSLDVWISGGFSPGANLPRSVATTSSAWAIDGIFQEIGTGFEEPNAFIQLLEALVAPYTDETGLNDSLPFPESLGSSSRMPGIDPYVDFAVGQIFGAKTAELNDGAQMRLLHLTCLNFISTCLSTFNEDLVVFANRSSISVDGAIRTSDLTAYICLHPFARVMEWIFNDKVMAALFSIVHQDAAEVAKFSPDSPLVLCLLRAIEVITLVMSLQSTYLNIVRPTIKMQPNHRRAVVANAAFASFEDGILNNLSIITDLGLFCGAGHPSLTIASLTLLEKLSTAPKLVFPSSTGTGRHTNRSKAIAAMESNNDVEQISRSLLNELESSTEIEVGPLSNSYLIKTHILDFLNGCLEAGSGRPTIAHLLLGFQCRSDTVEISSDSAFARRESIFHATLDFVTDGLVVDEESGVTLWLISLKHKALQLIKFLWGSRMTSHIVMNELRNNEFLTHIIVKELVVDLQTLWDGRSVGDDHFISTSSAECLFNFLQHRASALQYIAADLRQVSQEHAPALKQRLLSTMLGCTTVEDGEQIQHSTIFDLFDFMELEPQSTGVPPEFVHLSNIDLSVCMKHHDNSPSTYDLLWVEELLALKQNELSNSSLLVTLQDVVAFRNEAQALITYLRAENHLIQMTVTRIHALEAWVQVVLMMIKTGGLDGTNKTEFIMRALQLIMPKLEKYSLRSIDEAIQLADLAGFLVFNIDFDAQAFQKGDMGELISDRLFELFRICLRAVHSPIANAHFKETLYCILYRYLTGMSDVLKASSLIRKHSTNTLKSSGERLMDVICDDAYSGEQTCRISALLLLCAFVNLARLEDSKYIVECLARLNFIGLLVDSIKSMPVELRDTRQEGRLANIPNILVLTGSRCEHAAFILWSETCTLASCQPDPLRRNCGLECWSISICEGLQYVLN
jgi:nuclear pore complex protein Nup205